MHRLLIKQQARCTERSLPLYGLQAGDSLPSTTVYLGAPCSCMPPATQGMAHCCLLTLSPAEKPDGATTLSKVFGQKKGILFGPCPAACPELHIAACCNLRVLLQVCQEPFPPAAARCMLCLLTKRALALTAQSGFDQQPRERARKAGQPAIGIDELCLQSHVPGYIGDYDKQVAL